MEKPAMNNQPVNPQGQPTIQRLTQKGSEIITLMSDFSAIATRIETAVAQIQEYVTEGKITISLKTEDGQVKLEKLTGMALTKLEVQTQNAIARINEAAAKAAKQQTADNPEFQKSERKGTL
jgi:hypothetical protein